MPNVLKSGSLNLLEPSWPVQACNGIALPLPLFLASFVVIAVLKTLDGFASDMSVFIMQINTYELQANKRRNVVNLRLRILDGIYFPTTL